MAPPPFGASVKLLGSSRDARPEALDGVWLREGGAGAAEGGGGGAGERGASFEGGGGGGGGADAGDDTLDAARIAA